MEVYPRVYGGTFSPLASPWVYRGLSPRVRGNPAPGLPVITCIRSIPACTGEPHTNDVRYTVETVYPRVYGGTRVSLSVPTSVVGLSPRVRGNLLCHSLTQRLLRSIPACTGEPGGLVVAGTEKWVYPRVYGGTPTEFIRLFTAMSLFPGV